MLEALIDRGIRRGSVFFMSPAAVHGPPPTHTDHFFRAIAFQAVPDTVFRNPVYRRTTPVANQTRQTLAVSQKLTTRTVNVQK